MVALQTPVYTKLAELVPRGVSRCGAQRSLSAYAAADTLETALRRQLHLVPPYASLLHLLPLYGSNEACHP